MNEIEIYIDGACKGNPGPSGIGVVIVAGGKPLRHVHRFIGDATNNIAEYSALIAALEEGLLLGAKILSIKTDSELLARQMTNAYKVRSANILGLYTQAQHLIAGFSRVSINHIPRELNKEADTLANRAIAEYRKNEKKVEPKSIKKAV
jgi:ribonuclease HI